MNDTPQGDGKALYEAKANGISFLVLIRMNDTP